MSSSPQLAPAPAAGAASSAACPAPAVSLQPFFTAAQICAVLPRHPKANIESNWPLLYASLAKYCDASRPTLIAAIATVAVETGSFAPIKERGGPAYFTKLYWTDQKEAKDLGNRSAEDAIAFCGRGLVQITGYDNYLRYGHIIGVDLVAEPQRAMEPAVASHILALYFHERHIAAAAAAANWTRVRRDVNGGLNGWADFIRVIDALSALPIGVS